MKKEQSEVVTTVAYILIMIIFVSFFVIVSYLFQACWNLGFSKAFSLSEIDFQISAYMIGFISLVGLIFRGWGLDKFQSSNKEKNIENK
jgi:hypothetical protein